VCGFLLLLPHGVGAQQSRFDPKAQAVLDQTMTVYNNLSALRQKTYLRIRTDAPEQTSPKGDFQIELRWQKPNMVWYRELTVVTKGKPQGQIIVCDGTSLWRWQSATNTYTRSKAPASFAFLAALPEAPTTFDMLFRHKNPFLDFTPPMNFVLSTPDQVGNVDVDVMEGTPLSPLKRMSVRVLVGQKDHLFREMAMGAVVMDPKTRKLAHLEVTETVQFLDASPTFRASDFSFTPPPGSRLTANPSKKAER
jgi:hypothetical protein